ncbi:MAG: hypothetical protein ACYTDT_13550 [Planctomycetota bacterium]|jgi:hypothetical protein
MALKSLLISLLALLIVTCPAFAEPKYKALQADAAKLKTTLKDAKQVRDEAAARVAKNVKSQKGAEGAELARLKKEGVSLARAESKAERTANDAQTNLTNKQGEVRAAAAKFASEEIGNKKNKIADRIREVIYATDAWADAIGELPAVPATRNTSTITDPEEKLAIIADDKKVLKSFMSWADAEVNRLSDELKLMDKLLKHEATVQNQDDGPKMISESRALKKKLSKRKSDVRKLKNTASSRLKAMK